MLNRINFTINSRTYTVVASEDTEYLKSLGEYINGKVNLVLREGNHIMGEKPLVLAALNICDEYFKLLDKYEPQEKVSELLTQNKRLETELRELKQAELNASEKNAKLTEELELTERILEETEDKIKFLEGQILIKENMMKKQRSEFAIREKELLDMLESK